MNIMKRFQYILFGLLFLPLLVALPGQSSAQVYISHNIQQPALLVADAGGDQTSCPGDSLILGGVNTASGGTSPYAYNWNPIVGLNSINTPNPTVGVTTTTSYLVQIMDDRNCSAQDTVTVTANTPTAAFSSMPTNLSVAFSDLSTGNTGQSWFWDFGDGSSSTSQNPTYTYGMAGTYTVCLWVDQGTFCEDSTCQSITVTAVGLEEGLQGTLNIYPNPASGNVVHFELTGLSLTEDLVIEWFDLHGRQVNRYEGPASETLHRVGRNGLAAGVYEYRMSSGGALLGSGKLLLE